ncbi:hypothetical protein ACFL03_12360 [Thermodesulfobacteriota bacterium]
MFGMELFPLLEKSEDFLSFKYQLHAGQVHAVAFAPEIRPTFFLLVGPDKIEPDRADSGFNLYRVNRIA